MAIIVDCVRIPGPRFRTSPHTVKRSIDHLILLTNENAPPALLVRYRENPEEILKKLPHRRLNRDVSNRLAWTNWKRIADLLLEQWDVFSIAEKRFAKDLLGYLDSKTARKNEYDKTSSNQTWIGCLTQSVEFQLAQKRV